VTQIERNKLFIDRLMTMTGSRTLKELALVTGEDRSRVCNYSSGRKIGPAFLCKVSECLDISVKKLKEWM
jgi:hypothetical protein